MLPTDVVLLPADKVFLRSGIGKQGISDPVSAGAVTHLELFPE
jgi:hypothetical protein